MTRFIIHIGMHKTGTTSIQGALFAAREALAERGVLYPDLGPNHSHPLVSMFCRAPLDYYVNFYSGIDTPAKVAAFNERHRKALEEQLGARAWHTILLSGEELGTGLCTNELLEFKRYFDRLATSYQIVCYIRDPVGFATSATQQQIQAGLTLEELYLAPPRVRYRHILEKYIRIFGRARIQLCAYRPYRGHHQNHLDDFAHACGIPCLTEYMPNAQRQNKALPAIAIHALSLYNRRVPPHFIGKAGTTINPNRPTTKEIIQSLHRLGTGSSEPFSLPAATRSRAILGQLEDIGWLHTQIRQAPHMPAGKIHAFLRRWLASSRRQSFGAGTDRATIEQVLPKVQFTPAGPENREWKVAYAPSVIAYSQAARRLANALHERLHCQ